MESAHSQGGAAGRCQSRRHPTATHRPKRRQARRATFRTVIIPPRLKWALLIGASGLALAVGAASAPPALAVNECGAGAPGGTVTCTPAGNNFPNGIEYQVIDLTIVVQDGVIIDTAGGGVAPGGIVSGGAGNYGTLEIKAGTSGGSGITITTDEADAEGIYAYSNDSAVTVTSFGSITTSGSSAEGIYAAGSLEVNVTSNGNLSTSGVGSTAIAAVSGSGYVAIDSVGQISTTGAGAGGIHGYSVVGSVEINSQGAISTSGTASVAIHGEVGTFGYVAIVSDGDISSGGGGISAQTVEDAITIDSEGAISTTARGIAAFSFNGPISITSVGGIATTGNGARAIYAESVFYGDIGITSTGDITTAGHTAAGIHAFGPDGVTISSTGAIATQGDYSKGINAIASNGAGKIASAGDISTLGKEATGIYGATAGVLTITSDGGIATAGASASGIYASSGAALAIDSTGAIATVGSGAFGIFGNADTGGVTIESKGDISTQGTSSGAISANAQVGGVTIETSGDLATAGISANAIFAYAKDGAVTVTSEGDVSTGGTSAIGIFAIASTAPIAIDSDGAIATLGTSASGIQASGDGAIAIESEGDISTGGTSAAGIFAITTAGVVTIDSDGAIATLGASANGIAATSDAAITIASDGAISTAGLGANGITATGDAGDVAIAAGDSIATQADGSAAIVAFAKGGAVEVTSTAALSSLGFDGDGIRAISTDSGVTVSSTGDIATEGEEAQGILAVSETGTSITSSGAIRTSGADSHAIQGRGDTGSVIITAGTAIATGEDASGIHAVTAGAAGAAQIGISGGVFGGWGADARGVFIDANFASVLTVQSGASVGALSDIAIADGVEALSIFNQGTITGIVSLGSGADTFSNTSPTSWNLRSFTDTDGDGVRDTEGVAIADFGAGADSFNNSGTLRLASVAGATAFDTAGQIAHPGGGSSGIALEGVEQGFLTKLESFAHSGLITLQDGAAGDLLVITDQADGASAGNNAFTSNGGRLALDVVLDDGSSQQSDVLILDKAVTGTGATTLLISNAGGAGGATTGDGILVVNVRTQSDADAFALDGTPIAGAYRYDLYYQNLAQTDDNWYLRSSFFEGALDYPSISTGAVETWYSDLGSLHDQLGKRRALVNAQEAAAGQLAALPTASDVADTSAVRMTDAGQGGWFRVVGADLDIEQDGASDFELETVRAEAGFDVGFDNVLSDDWLVLGAFAGYGWASLGFESEADANFNIATVGAYATYFRGPYYLDALVKFDWLDGDYRSDVVKDDGDVELPVAGVSIETGYRFDLTQGGLYLQPEAQLSYAHVGDDSFSDDTGAEIRLQDADSLRGRVGARLGQELLSDSGGATGNFYFEASVSQEFLGETEANVSGLAIEQELPETRFEVGAGFDIALPKDGVSFTLDADYVFGDEVDGVAATGGIRINW